MRIFRRGKEGICWIEYREPVTGKTRRESLRVTGMRAAENLSREKMEQIARRHHRLAERKRWSEAVEAFLKEGAVHKDPSSVAEDRRTLQGMLAKEGRPSRPARFVPPDIVRYVDDVRVDHIAKYVADRKALGRSPFRINRELRTLRAFFNWCAGESRLWTAGNPAREVKQLPEPQGVAARCLTDEEIKGALKGVEGTRLEGLVLLALNHGLRLGELIHLRRDTVDLVQGRLWVRHDRLTSWKVKGGQERIVHLNEVTREWLARHLAEPVRDLSPYLFSSEFGQPLRREAVVMRMGRVLRGIGIKRGGFHMFRHTWGTKQAEAGTQMSVLKTMGGWRDWRSMEKYQHIGDEVQREAAARVVIGGRSSKVVPLRRVKRSGEGK
jgi:integrase